MTYIKLKYMVTNRKYTIKASSYIINLLGEELIGSDSLALFELVKNSYDADSSSVKITLNRILENDGTIIVEDTGNGMTPEIIERAWLTIGTDYKRKEFKISPIYHRVSMGNKGVGRLAVHRLAHKIRVETQAKNELFGSELVINWDKLVSEGSHIEDLSVSVNHGVAGLFEGGHGTRIILSDLKNHHWNAFKVKELVSKLQGIVNPFCPKDDFKILINSDDEMVQRWIDSVTPSSELFANSLYRFDFELSKSSDSDEELASFRWKYSFNPINLPQQSLATPHVIERKEQLMIDGKAFSVYDNQTIENFYLKNKFLNAFGTIQGCFYGFSSEGKILDIIYGAGKRELLKTYLSKNGGVKIFRDGIRVYNYGEPNDDWLGINQNRAKRMGSHFSKNQIIGGISLGLSETKNSLIEKTNREGFIENESLDLFTIIIWTIYSYFETWAIPDREKIKTFVDKNSITKKIGFSETIKELERKLEARNLTKEFSSLVGQVKRDYDNMRNVMLNSGMNGLNLTIVFHEVEREMGFISHDIMKKGCDLDNIRMRIRSLMALIEKFMPLTKNSKNSIVLASKIVERVSTIHATRFNYHRVLFSNRFSTDNNEDFNITGPAGMIMSALSNLVDNAIFWARERRAKEGEIFKPAVMVAPDLIHFDGPAIIVADNGRGFQMDEDEMILPFRSLKPNGMGVGLYYASLVMEIVGGKLLFPPVDSLDLPTVYNGACVALVFPKMSKEN